MTPKIKIILVKHNGKIHPVIGAWHISLLNDLTKKINSGVRKILFWAQSHPLEFINFSNHSHDPFFNINYKSDLEIASEIDKKI